MFLAGGLWDIVSAPRAATRANQQRRVVVAPTALSTAGGAIPGMAVGGSF